MKSLSLLLSVLCLSCVSVSAWDENWDHQSDLSSVLVDRTHFKNWLRPQLVKMNGWDIHNKLKRASVQIKEQICFMHFQKEEIDWNGWSYENRLNDCMEFIIHEYSCDNGAAATYDYDSDVTCSEESRHKYLHNNFRIKI